MIEEGAEPFDSQLGHVAFRLWSERMALNKEFPGDMLIGRSWELLLVLLLAKIQGQTVTFGEAAKAAGIPSTTALRLSERLESYQLIRRSRARNDQRKVVLQLTGEGVRKTERVLEQVSRMWR